MMNPDIQNALKFIKRNYDFFKAPIEEQAKFQAWVKTSGLTPFMKSISDLLKHSFRVKDHYHLYLVLGRGSKWSAEGPYYPQSSTRGRLYT